MSKSEAAPGPWTVREEESRRPLPRVFIGGSDGIYFAEVFTGPSSALGSVRANAALIAAAPDLYAALAEMVTYWDNGTPVHPAAEVVADARAALAQAEGGER